jgi:hypothetical protein
MSITNRYLFLKKFKELCNIYGLTYSEAIFKPYKFSYSKKVELEFYVGGYRLWIKDFNELCAESLIILITNFGEKMLEDETSIDVIARHLYETKTYLSPLSKYDKDFEGEYKLWEEYYNQHGEISKPFYLEQDIAVLSIDKMRELADNYEVEVSKLLKKESEKINPATGKLFTPNEYFYKPEGEEIERSSWFNRPELYTAKDLGLKPTPSPLVESYIEGTDGRTVKETSYRLNIPQFAQIRVNEFNHKKATKEKIMYNFEKWLDKQLNLV